MAPNPAIVELALKTLDQALATADPLRRMALIDEAVQLHRLALASQEGDPASVPPGPRRLRAATEGCVRAQVGRRI
ncbi:MAG: hypothetical protein JO127_09860 [Caulobacteraceae bacterium]|nr:hypothetical protein [Caulobacteraceae bacterium]